MKLINNSKNAMMHKVGNDFLVLEVGKVLEVSEDVAKIWLKYPDIQPYATPEDIEEAKKQAVKEALAKEKAKAKTKKCAPCYENGKVPAQEDCDKCKGTASKRSSKK